MVNGDLRGVSQASVSRFVKRVSIQLAEQLAQFVHFPDNEDAQRRTILQFFGQHNFPSVIGCVDGTHIPICSPGGDHAETFRNRKGFFSLNVQVVSGPNQQIMDIVVRHPGSAHDSLIFDRSAVRVLFEQRRIIGLLLGDSAYACRFYLLTPVLNPANDQERRYNGSHRRTRNIVERLFGTWKRRFPCLSFGLRTKLETTQAVICALAVLHNIGLANDAMDEDILLEEPAIPHNIANNDAIGLAFRRQFIQTHFQ